MCECDTADGWNGTLVWNTTHWTGSCQDRERCTAQPCGDEKGSVCIEGRGYYSCECLKGWSGGGKNRPCEDGSVSCNGVGQVGKTGTGDCVCDAGFEGTPSWNGTHWNNPCRDIDECENVICGGDIPCENKINSYFCNCSRNTDSDKAWVGGGTDKTCDGYTICKRDDIVTEVLKLLDQTKLVSQCLNLLANVDGDYDDLLCPCLGDLDEKVVSPFNCRMRNDSTETITEAWQVCQSCKKAHGCDKCYNFSKISPRTVEVCHSCSGLGQKDCTAATCTPGYDNFDPAKGVCSGSDDSVTVKDNPKTVVIIGAVVVAVAVFIGCLYLVRRMLKKAKKRREEKEATDKRMIELAEQHAPELGSQETSKLAEQEEMERLGSKHVVAQASSLYGMNLAQPLVPVPLAKRTFRKSNFRLFYNAGADALDEKCRRNLLVVCKLITDMQSDK